MICGRCLQRASSGITTTTLARPFSTALSPAAPSTSTFSASASAAARRTFAHYRPLQASAAPPTPPKSGPEGDKAPASAAAAQAQDPVAAAANDTAATAPLSSCPEGTVLAGLNYFKGRADPVALADSAYPPWLWRCLDVTVKREDDAVDDDAEAEFSKSKKQRRLAAKRQRAQEERLLAEGNMEALAPKVPLTQQSINLPGNEEGTPEGALEASRARENLRGALRRERRAKIKENNYLKSM